MALEQNKRPKRVPLTNEEVANVIAYKKRRDIIRRLKLKNSLPYKIQNIYNVASFFVCCEIIICFLFPTNYEPHFSTHMRVQYSDVYNENGKPVVSKITARDTEGREFDIMINDYIETPPNESFFFIAKDYLIQKDLKGRFPHSDHNYSLYTVGPVLLLCSFVIIVSLIIYINNLNETAYSLTALTVLNTLALLGICSF